MRAGAVTGRITDIIETRLVEFMAGRRAVKVNGAGNRLADFTFQGHAAR